jgi:tRNA A64-2'-O-ribosylphosphate transferase
MVSITPAALKTLWEFFDAQYGRRDSHSGKITVIDVLPRQPVLDEPTSQLQLSRSQVNRQWDRWRTARRDEVKEHKHAASLHAHRRRAFGADDTLYNRLQSISHDARFVSTAAARFAHWPLVANLRCGQWYAPPAAFATTVRFKSTDGHKGEWNLNGRRLNLHLATLISQRGGVLLVDATRRGRALPDSFAKTVPIWCACLNRAIAAKRGYLNNTAAAWCTQLRTSPCVDAAEKTAIEKRLDGFVEVLQSCEGSEQVLCALRKPLRPLWLVAAPDGGQLIGAEAEEVLATMQSNPDALAFYPVVCLSASEPVDRERRSEYTYLQGSADDEEDWAAFPGGKRLTAALFWQYSGRLLQAQHDACDALASSIAALPDALAGLHEADEGGQGIQGAFRWVKRVQRSDASGGAALAVGSRRAGQPPECWEYFDAVINVSLHHCASMPPAGSDAQQPSYLHLAVPEGKRDPKALELLLPAALRFAARHLARGRRLLVHSDAGNDRAVAVAMAVVLAFFKVTDASRCLNPACIQDASSHPLLLLPPPPDLTQAFKAPAPGAATAAIALIGEAIAGAGAAQEHAAAAGRGGGEDGEEETHVHEDMWSAERLEALAEVADDAEVRARVGFEPEVCKAALTRCLHVVSMAWTSAAPPRHTLKKLHRFFGECGQHGASQQGKRERQREREGGSDQRSQHQRCDMRGGQRVSRHDGTGAQVAEALHNGLL